MVIKKYRYLRADTVLIHIGKCGGTTVRNELVKNKIYYIEKHVCEVNFNPRYKYVIVIRNSIQRFISAFNWRYHLLKSEIKINPDELEGLNEYKTVNRLTENLYVNKVMNRKIDKFINKVYNNGYPSHIGMGIHYHIGNFLTNCQTGNILGVVTTENIKDDMKSLFNIEISAHENINSGNYDTELIELGYSNLRRYLQKDYECIQKLFELGLISKEKYAILSR